MRTSNVKISYIPYEGVMMQNREGISVILKYEKGIPNISQFPCTKERHTTEKGKCYTLYLFDNERFRFYTDGKRHMEGAACYDNFYYQGINIVGMKLEELERLGLFSLRCVRRKQYILSHDMYFRYMDIYADEEHRLLLYVWRGKVRGLTLRSPNLLKYLASSV